MRYIKYATPHIGRIEEKNLVRLDGKNLSESPQKKYPQANYPTVTDKQTSPMLKRRIMRLTVGFSMSYSIESHRSLQESYEEVYSRGSIFSVTIVTHMKQ